MVCTISEEGIISCVGGDGFRYFFDAATGTLVHGDRKQITSSKAQFAVNKLPTLLVSSVDCQGQFSLKFSESMNLEAFRNTTNDLRSVKEANSTNDTSTRYLYLLSEKHLHIKVKSLNSTQPKFYWYATNITSTEIMIQVVFQDPLYISSDGLFDSLVITVLPPTLPYLKSLVSGALIENPLQTVVKYLPPQVIIGQTTIEVSKATNGVEALGKYSVITNVAIQLTVSGSMQQMWSMINAQQIVLSYNYLNVQVPGNVIMVMT